MFEDKQEEVQTEVTKRIIYCDRCKKKITEEMIWPDVYSDEDLEEKYDNADYHRFFGIEVTGDMRGQLDWIRINKDLCDACFEIYRHKLSFGLRDFVENLTKSIEE